MNQPSPDKASKSQLIEFYSNKNVFLTGVTGFVGKVLLEKLLRSVPNIGNIYLLIRENRGKQPRERLGKILSNPLFDVVRKEVPNYREQLIPIRGDLIHDGLGLGTKETELILNNVNIVFHVAATVNFNGKLYDAARINVKGTHEVLELCEKMKKLYVVMVASTCFSFAPRTFIKEVFLNPPMPPETFLKLIATVNEKIINRISSKLLGDWPNTYTYTKAIMEDIVRAKVQKLPVGMTRLPICISTYREPIEAWTDNLQSVFGAILGFGTGAIHVYFGRGDIYYELMPVDYCVNAILACTYDTYIESKISVNEAIQPVYNCGFGKFKLNSIGEINRFMNLVTEEHPFKQQLWKRSVFFTTCPFLFITLSIILHYIPALFMDAAYVIKRKKPRFVNLYNRFLKENCATICFSTKQWIFDNHKLLTVWKKMNDTDKKMFTYNYQSINEKKMVGNIHLAVKKYILKDKMEPESLEQCRKQYKRLIFFHNILTMVFTVSVMFFLWKEAFFSVVY